MVMADVENPVLLPSSDVILGEHLFLSQQKEARVLCLPDFPHVVYLNQVCCSTFSHFLSLKLFSLVGQPQFQKASPQVLRPSLSVEENPLFINAFFKGISQTTRS